jgi:hypothetical protein
MGFRTIELRANIQGDIDLDAVKDALSVLLQPITIRDLRGNKLEYTPCQNISIDRRGRLRTIIRYFESV